MQTILETRRAACKAWYRRQSRIGRIALWLSAVLALAILGVALNVARAVGIVAIVFTSLGLLPLLPVLAYRWITRSLLWKVRNRLIVTYLLMGLAPMILFGTLGAIALYLFAGQYATNTALTLLDESLVELSDETVSASAFSSSNPIVRSEPAVVGKIKPSARPPLSVVQLKGNSWQPLLLPNGSEQPSPFLHTSPPAWLHPPFRAIVNVDGALYLCSEVSVQQGNGSLLLLGSLPLKTDSLESITQDLGMITLFSNDGAPNGVSKDIDVQGIKVRQDPTRAGNEGFATVRGGTLPDPTYFFDKPVFFSSPFRVLSWQTGTRLNAMMWVVSRPNLLYKRLFATSVEIGAFVRAGLFGIAVVFAVFELLALLMAAGLSRTITRSVADLSRGTKEIDAGNLSHRVRVARHDQLGELAASFNGMAASISDLLVQQSEKDRLLNELAIAQEVQATLFPRSPASMPGLEMHAVCLPAQTVGGDYFDFIFGPDSAVCLALGDISGKGISAALLMASLHSAVRAFSLDGAVEHGALLSPAVLLDDINRHLYRSTQSARYATLFIACYDAPTRTLTYSNGGHLPPLVLSSDGTVRRLECGGPVIGLLGTGVYEQAHVELQKGDLLIAFTDGLTEPEQGLEEFGEQRLLECVRRNAILPLPDIMSHTLQGVQKWIGDREQPDDITLLLARQL